MIKFNLPGFYEHLALNTQFLILLNKHPEYLNDNTEIESIYGNFQFCIFDGGRVFNDRVYRQTSKEEIIAITNMYNIELGVPIRLIYTNTKVPENQYTNRFCNIILSLCENNINQIVVNDSGLENYIRINYPKYKIISSTTKCLTNLDSVKQELNNDYYLVCLDYNLNHNIDFLNSFSQEEKNKTELLINAICPPKCPHRKEHYNLNSEYSLQYGKSYSMEDKCLIRHCLLDPTTLNSPNNLTPQMIKEIYEPMGFSHFKIEGRTLSDIDLACSYVYYMIKPEYQFLVLTELFQDAKLQIIQ